LTVASPKLEGQNIPERGVVTQGHMIRFKVLGLFHISGMAEARVVKFFYTGRLSSVSLGIKITLKRIKVRIT